MPLNVALPVPTSVTPANSTTIATSRPTLGAVVTGSVPIIRNWQISATANFTVVTMSIVDSTYSTTKSAGGGSPIPTRLPQGTWYIRCRTQDSIGDWSNWSTNNLFTISHVPSSSNRSHWSGAAYTYAPTITVTWDFVDPDPEDYQTGYQVEFWKLNDIANKVESGIITSGATSHVFAVPDATWKATDLRWRLRVYDQDSQRDDWSLEQSFYLYDGPLPAITFPTDTQVISTAQPTITWTFSAANGRTQDMWRAFITQFGVGTIADSGYRAEPSTRSWTVPFPVILIGQSYTLYVVVADSVGMQVQVLSNFTATYDLPDAPIFSLNTSNFRVGGVVYVDWSTAVVEATCTGWKVFRRRVGYGPAWTLLAELPPAARGYYDYLAPSASDAEYSVVQTATSFGEVVESPYPVQSFYGESKYALVCPSDPSLNLSLYIVTADSFEDEQEMASQNLIGRGRRVEYGTRFGQTGSLTADIRDQQGGPTAREQRLTLGALRSSGLPVYLRTPFGDVWSVAAQSANVSRVAGVGMQEMATVTIAYTEITA